MFDPRLDPQRPTERGADFEQASLVGFQAPLVRLVGYSGRRVRRASFVGWVGGP